MRRRMHLLAMLVTLGGGAALLGPAPASATYKPPPADLLEPALNYCCKNWWGTYGCCGENGCRITSERCQAW
jgi:hypothetical protein